MGHRELLLTIGAIVAFGLMMLSINNVTLGNSESATRSQVELIAVNVAQRFIEEAKMKAFDELAIANSVSSPTGFTIPPMGPGFSETYPNFDDVDDFNGFTTTDSDLLGAVVDSVSIAVDYVNDSDLNVVVLSQTYYKKMRVRVFSQYLTAPVRVDYVFAYQRSF